MNKDDKVKAASAKLGEQLGLYVGSAHGFPDSDFEGEPETYIIVWSDEKVSVPNSFEGFRVVVRGIPVAF